MIEHDLSVWDVAMTMRAGRSLDVPQYWDMIKTADEPINLDIDASGKVIIVTGHMTIAKFIGMGYIVAKGEYISSK